MAGYDTLYRLVEGEIRQRIEDGGIGVDAPAWHERLAACGASGRPVDLDFLYMDLMRLDPADDWPWREPDGLEPILADRAAELAPLAKPSGKTIFEQVHGGWLGRCCGCTLGKPFEIEPFTRHSSRGQRREVRAWLEGANAWPLEDYVPASSRAERQGGLRLAAPDCVRGAVRRMEPDDAILAALLSLTVIERHGRDFRTGDVARVWLGTLPFDSAPPAEAQTLVNLVCEDAFVHGARSEEAIESLDWAVLASWHNPYREWAGAMARAAVHGLAAPGDPDTAAVLAWRDARLSHTRNGLYAAMFQAALVAAAFVESNPALLIGHALARVPRTSRLAQAVRDAVAISQAEGSWERAWDRLMATSVGEYDPRHAVTTTALLVLALLYGEGDFGHTIGIAASCGCNPAALGAAAGTVIGVSAGVRAIPSRWTQPLHNTLCGGLPSPAQTTISDTSRRTMRVLEAAVAAVLDASP